MNFTTPKTITSIFGYDPFGMVLVGRSWSIESQYRYGFNGKEKDDEVKGDGNQYDYGFRIYDPRLGRFLSIDPLSSRFAWQSPYAYAYNSPIYIIDFKGLGGVKADKKQAKADLKWARRHDKEFNKWYKQTNKEYKSKGRTLLIRYESGATQTHSGDLNTLIGGEIREDAIDGTDKLKNVDWLYYDHIGNGLKTGYELKSVTFEHFHGGQHNFHTQHNYSIDETYQSELKNGLEFHHWGEAGISWDNPYGESDGEKAIYSTGLDKNAIRITGRAKPDAPSTVYSPYYNQDMHVEGYSYTIFYGITEYSKPVLCYIKDPQFSLIQKISNPSYFIKYSKQPNVICNPSDAVGIDHGTLNTTTLSDTLFK